MEKILLRLFCFVEENKVFRGIEHSVSSSKTNCSFMLKQIVSIGRNKLFFHVGTKCSSLLEHSVLP